MNQMRLCELRESIQRSGIGFDRALRSCMWRMTRRSQRSWKPWLCTTHSAQGKSPWHLAYTFWLVRVYHYGGADSFYHCSRRQYTQKFREWGLCKNIPTNVMKSALRKRARAGENGMSVKFRGTAISKENMDRWQQRVPNFNPMSSPTACKSSGV